MRKPECKRGHDLTPKGARMNGGYGGCRECQNERLRTRHADRVTPYTGAKKIVTKYKPDDSDPAVILARAELAAAIKRNPALAMYAGTR